MKIFGVDYNAPVRVSASKLKKNALLAREESAAKTAEKIKRECTFVARQLNASNDTKADFQPENPLCADIRSKSLEDELDGGGVLFGRVTLYKSDSDLFDPDSVRKLDAQISSRYGQAGTDRYSISRSPKTGVRYESPSGVATFDAKGNLVFEPPVCQMESETPAYTRRWD